MAGFPEAWSLFSREKLVEELWSSLVLEKYGDGDDGDDGEGDSCGKPDGVHDNSRHMLLRMMTMVLIIPTTLRMIVIAIEFLTIYG